MTSTRITSIQTLQDYLHHAMRIEHATIPPYLSALYSIHPQTNLQATLTLRVVVVEEMLHLTLAANLLNAVGGTPDLTAPGFVPVYPAALPDGEQDFKVDLQPFSKDAVKTFLKIERPAAAPSEDKRRVAQQSDARSALAVAPEDLKLRYYSIGEFYEEVKRGLAYLHEKEGDKLFSGPKERQVTQEYYYSGGGKVIPVTNLESAVAAVNTIVQQGEGLDDRRYTVDGELAHDFRFEQLHLGRFYKTTDSNGHPTGEKIDIDWDAVYPFKKNAKLSDYKKSPELHAAAVAFNQEYGSFLQELTQAFNGKPALLLDAVPKMFAIKAKILQLIRNPMPGKAGVNAAPTFEMAEKAAEVRA